MISRIERLVSIARSDMKFKQFSQMRLPPTTADSRSRFCLRFFRSNRVPSPIQHCFIAVSSFRLSSIWPDAWGDRSRVPVAEILSVEGLLDERAEVSGLGGGGLSKPLPSDFAAPTLLMRQGANH